MTANDRRPERVSVTAPRCRVILALFLAFEYTTTAFALQQRVAFGFETGFQATEPFGGAQSFIPLNNEPRNAYKTEAGRFAIGPTLETSLPRGFAFEAEALYRRQRYRADFLDIYRGFRDSRKRDTTARSFEFPLVLKKYMPAGDPARPYIAIGFTARYSSSSTRAEDVTVASSGGIGFPQTTTTFSGEIDTPELVSNWSGGIVCGAGVDFSFGAVHIAPELRCTRWAAQPFRDRFGSFGSNKNAVDILIGFTLRR